MRKSKVVNITTMRKFDKFHILKIINILNSWKRKIKWLASLNPFMLYTGYVIFLIIPYVPNFPLYLILLNKRINKWLKGIFLVFSIVFTILYNILIAYYIFK